MTIAYVLFVFIVFVAGCVAGCVYCYIIESRSNPTTKSTTAPTCAHDWAPIPLSVQDRLKLHTITGRVHNVNDGDQVCLECGIVDNTASQLLFKHEDRERRAQELITDPTKREALRKRWQERYERKDGAVSEVPATGGELSNAPGGELTLNEEPEKSGGTITIVYGEGSK